MAKKKRKPDIVLKDYWRDKGQFCVESGYEFGLPSPQPQKYNVFHLCGCNCTGGIFSGYGAASVAAFRENGSGLCG